MGHNGGDMTQDNTYLLLVEDNQDDIDLTIRALRRHNLINDIVVLQDGAAALDFLLLRGEYAERVDTLPQFVLLDINLPKLSGLDVLAELRKDERTRLLPIVMLTTSQEEHDVALSYRNGANSYVRKPVDFEAFSEAIRQLGVYWLVLNENPWSAAT